MKGKKRTQGAKTSAAVTYVGQPRSLAEYKARRGVQPAAGKSSLGRLRHLLHRFQNNYAPGPGPQSNSCTPTVDTTMVATRAPHRDLAKQDYSTNHDGKSPSNVQQRYMSQTPELEVRGEGSGLGNYVAGEQRGNMARSSSQSHSFVHPPHTMVPTKESSRHRSKRDPRPALPPTNRSLSTIRNLHPIQEYYSCEPHNKDPALRPVEGKTGGTVAARLHEDRLRSRTISTSRRRCVAGALRRSIVALRANHINSSTITKVKEESEDKSKATAFDEQRRSGPVGLTPGRGETARKTQQGQPSARRPKRPGGNCRAPLRTHNTPTPCAVDSPSSGLPRISVQRIGASPEAGLRVKRRISISKAEAKRLKEEQRSKLESIRKGRRESKKQFSATSLYRAQTRLLDSGSKNAEHRKSLNHTVCGAVAEGRLSGEKKRSERRTQFATDVIDEAAEDDQEDELDIGKVAAKCHLERNEQVELLPTLRAEGAEMLGSRLAVCSVLLFVFEPELEIFSSLTCS